MTTEVLSAAAPYLIEQDYASYTEEQHSVWAELVGRALPELEKHAAREYLEGFEIIGLAEGSTAESGIDQQAPCAAHRMELNSGERISSRAGVL